MRYSTSHFLSRRAAIYYFSDYESAPVDKRETARMRAERKTTEESTI
jgi:hypothetical protein